MRRCSLVYLALILVSCYSVSGDIPADAPSEIYFRDGNRAFIYNDYRKARQIYHKVLERFPDDPTVTANARYELAFLDYVDGNLDKAQEQLEELSKDIGNTQDSEQVKIKEISLVVLENIKEKKNSR